MLKIVTGRYLVILFHTFLGKPKYYLFNLGSLEVKSCIPHKEQKVTHNTNLKTVGRQKTHIAYKEETHKKSG